MTRTALHLNLLIFFLAGFLLDLQPFQVVSRSKSSLPDFVEFYESVQNGETGVLRGVYVPEVLALPIVQQPADNPYYVSNHEGEATEFSIPARYGNIGLLAHNTLSGRLFSGLAVGQEVHLVYGDGTVEHFVVAEILQFQALDPESINSTFRNLNGDEVLTAGEMFNRAYVGERHLVFQTCIEAEGNASWGRLFVVAVPK